MRPHQECLLLASGFEGRQAGVPWLGSPEQAEVAQLRDFVRAMLARRSPLGSALREVDLFGHPDGVATLARRHDGQRAVFPVDPAQAMVAFDLAALLHAPQLCKHAVLPPRALARDMARIDGAVDPLSLLTVLQDALRHCRAVTVFDGVAARDLALLGAGRIAVLPLPAMARPSADTGRLVIHLFDHDPAGLRSKAVATAVAEVLPEALLVAAEVPTTLPGSGLHLHLGAALGDATPWRVVDSFAARCPVVQLVDGHFHADAGEFPGMAVEPMRTGLLAGSVAEAVAGLVRLAADAALVDVFRRTAGHAAEAFNRRIEDRLREMAP